MSNRHHPSGELALRSVKQASPVRGAGTTECRKGITRQGSWPSGVSIGCDPSGVMRVWGFHAACHTTDPTPHPTLLPEHQDVAVRFDPCNRTKSCAADHAGANEHPTRRATSATGRSGVRSSTVQASACHVDPMRTRLR